MDEIGCEGWVGPTLASADLRYSEVLLLFFISLVCQPQIQVLNAGRARFDSTCFGLWESPRNHCYLYQANAADVVESKLLDLENLRGASTKTFGFPVRSDEYERKLHNTM